MYFPLQVACKVIIEAGTPELVGAGSPVLVGAGSPVLVDAGTPVLVDAGTPVFVDADTPGSDDEVPMATRRPRGRKRAIAVEDVGTPGKGGASWFNAEHLPAVIGNLNAHGSFFLLPSGMTIQTQASPRPSGR